MAVDIDAVFGSYPQLLVKFCKCFYVAVAQGVFVVAAAVYPIVAAVVAVQTVFRTDPDEAVAVLQATSGGIVRKLRQVLGFGKY